MSAYRFVHLGDLHLDASERNVDRLAALDYVITQQEADPSLLAWLWPGDLNHSAMTIANRNALVERVIRMAGVAPVVIVPGNHDRPGDLDFLAQLRTRYLISVMTTPRIVASRDKQIPIAVFGLPYPTKAGLVGAGLSHDDSQATAATALDRILMQAGEELAAARARGAITAAIGHVAIRGAVPSVGQPLVGQEIAIDQASLARLGPIYIGLNHIHRHQVVGGAIYAGSLCRLDWGEIEPKGYVVVELTEEPVLDLDEAIVSGHPRWRHTWRFCEVPVAPMYHVEGELTRDRFTWQICRGPGGVADQAPQDWSGCDVRVRVRYGQAERGVLGDAQVRVRAPFVGARRLEVELIALPDRALRAPEVVAATTLSEKLRAWARLEGVEWTDEIARRADILLAARELVETDMAT
jgi:hypothetical protein